MRLQDKVALVTGAGRGIGRAIAERFAVEGARVVVNDVNGESAQETVEMIKTQGGTAAPIEGDTSQETHVERMVQFVVDTYGGLDILVNNAGVEIWKPIHEMTAQEWDRIMGINLRGVFLVSKHAVRQMLSRNRAGQIVNMASVAGLVSFPGLGAYSTSKHGVIGLTKTMALELRPHNIRVNAVCPAFIDTDMAGRLLELLKSQGLPQDDLLMQNQGRLGHPGEVANLALFLASDESSFMSGAAVPIDNGCTAQ
ncbi:MAG: 3-oxoacyl-ACP reductase FabG [Deltaproteobacteria bacterium]|nr:3-oxoacyl-ACP reductase FabG [Deltaproteobacteria bacterium]